MNTVCTTAPVQYTKHNIQASSSAKAPQQPSHPPPSRRALLATTLLTTTLINQPRKATAAQPIPPPPTVGDCPDCIGVVNDTLNACNLESQSCISTLNDDELHFVAPWQFDLDTPEKAADMLIEVATGGYYKPGLIKEPFGISKSDAAGYIAKGTLAVFTNQALPDKPQAKRAEFVPFDGVLVEKRTTDSGSLYVRLCFGTDGGKVDQVEDPANVIDAEFLFFPNDSIVNVRAASRAQPQESKFVNPKDLQLSFTSGIVVDKNIAKHFMEDLRKALAWDLAPVITDFDPRFNPDAPVWVEKFFMPFNDRNDFKPSGEPYPQN